MMMVVGSLGILSFSSLAQVSAFARNTTTSVDQVRFATRGSLWGWIKQESPNRSDFARNEGVM